MLFHINILSLNVFAVLFSIHSVSLLIFCLTMLLQFYYCLFVKPLYTVLYCKIYFVMNNTSLPLVFLLLHPLLLPLLLLLLL